MSVKARAIRPDPGHADEIGGHVKVLAQELAKPILSGISCSSSGQTRTNSGLLNGKVNPDFRRMLGRKSKFSPVD